MYRVDFIVVVESVVSLVLEVVRPSSSLDISALRGLRVLRPLRAITYIQQVRSLRFLSGLVEASQTRLRTTRYGSNVLGICFQRLIQSHSLARMNKWLPFFYTTVFVFFLFRCMHHHERVC